MKRIVTNELITDHLLFIEFIEYGPSFCFQTYKDKELRQIIIMRLKWSDLSILMTKNVGLFVGEHKACQD